VYSAWYGNLPNAKTKYLPQQFPSVIAAKAISISYCREIERELNIPTSDSICFFRKGID
jgi:hypothetical protein